MHATREQMKTIGRLLRRADFLRVQGKGRKWVAQGLIVQIAAREEESAPSRFGLVVSKRLDKRAVGRNRMRRRLRAAAYEILPQAAPRGLDIVLIGRHNTGEYPFDALCRDLKWCLRKLGASDDPAAAPL